MSELASSSMPPRWEEVLELCQERLRAFQAQGYRFPYTPLEIARIVWRNIFNGRFERVYRARAKGNLPPMRSLLPDYVDRVIKFYHQEGERVRRLEAGDPEEWTRLQEQLLTIAYYKLKGFRLGKERAYLEAEDFAQQTCEAIFSSTYPYDVAFDAWTTRILLNIIIQKYTRSTDLFDRTPYLLSLDELIRRESNDRGIPSEALQDPISSRAFKQVEDRMTLSQPLKRLSPAQRTVILGIYFHDLKATELAKLLNRTVGAIYLLHWRALHRLRNMLNGDRSYKSSKAKTRNGTPSENLSAQGNTDPPTESGKRRKKKGTLCNNLGEGDNGSFHLKPEEEGREKKDESKGRESLTSD